MICIWVEQQGLSGTKITSKVTSQLIMMSKVVVHQPSIMKNQKKKNSVGSVTGSDTWCMDDCRNDSINIVKR